MLDWAKVSQRMQYQIHSMTVKSQLIAVPHKLPSKGVTTAIDQMLVYTLPNSRDIMATTTGHLLPFDWVY